jgi:hypothetical protein
VFKELENIKEQEASNYCTQVCIISGGKKRDSERGSHTKKLAR